MLRQSSQFLRGAHRLVTSTSGSYAYCRAAIAGFATDITITTVPMPSLSPTMTHGSISVWNKNPGDVLAPGDVLCEIETDKASVGFEVQDDGILAKILTGANGGEVECGLPIALTVEDEEAYATFLTLPESEYGIVDSSDSGASAGAAVVEPVKEVTPASTSATVSVESSRRMSPAARHMVDSQILDISQVVGSSKRGLVTKGDIILGVKTGVAVKGDSSARQRSPPPAAAKAASAPAAPAQQVQQQQQSTPVSVSSEIGGAFIDIKNSNMRKVIAKRLTESKTTVPHQYTAVQCEIDELLALRKTLKNDFGVNVSVNDVVIKAAALALRDVPECNGKWIPKSGIIE